MHKEQLLNMHHYLVKHFIHNKETNITVMLNKDCIYSKTNHQCRGF